MIDFIVLMINTFIGFLVWFRLGRQDVISKISKMLLEDGKLIQAQKTLILALKAELKKYEDNQDECVEPMPKKEEK